MPFKKTSKVPSWKRKGMGKKIMRRRRTNLKSKRTAGVEFASMKEVHEFAPLNVNSAYFDYALSLARFPRAVKIAEGYKEYRIAKVEYIFKPRYDTYATTFDPQVPGTVNSPSVPHLYAMIDRNGSMRDYNTSDQLRSAGAKPRRLDDKIVKWTYSPGVLQYAQDVNNLTNQFSTVKISPWLSCDKNNNTGTTGFAPSSIDHLGIVWMADSTNTPVLLQYDLEVVAHFQFRKPVFVPTIGDQYVSLPAATQVIGKYNESA